MRSAAGSGGWVLSDVCGVCVDIDVCVDVDVDGRGVVGVGGVVGTVGVSIVIDRFCFCCCCCEYACGSRAFEQEDIICPLVERD